MAVRKYVLWVMIVFVLTGCGTAFKAKWKNFNAYYNTFYNAQKSYESGLEKNLGQAREYNPLQPIRIHPKPVNAGAQDFEQAIQKGADILRSHQESKWVDDALALIGKSYYFRREYFSADQKFRELALTTQSEELQQQAIVWRGRVLLDMESYNEGVAYLSEEISNREDEWNNSNLYEVKALLAQHYVALENWQQAAKELLGALPNLSKKEYNERGYFLLGQLQERLGNLQMAYDAYDAVQNFYVEYRLQYLAERKTAEVARDLGRNDVAYRIFNAMARDDKNLEYKTELDYEMARTEHERDNFIKAEQLYKQVLNDEMLRPSPELQALAYYGLAEIYRFEYDNFSMAAAYYDSASQNTVPAENLPNDFKASELAESFGAYSRTQQQIKEADSLLSLGMMNRQELDSALSVIRTQRLRELQELREAEEAQQNQILTLNDDEASESSSSNKNGFLNENNAAQQENIRRQFMSVWGDRPLADYWRVRSMMNVSSAELRENREQETEIKPNNGSELVTIKIDLSDVPFSKTAQDSVRKAIAAYQYELGNLFYLSLNLPDSAIHYFKKVIQSTAEDDIKTLSLYSLSELHSDKGNEKEAIRYAEELLDEYPSTLYARRLAAKFNLDYEFEDKPVMEDPVTRYELILSADSLSYTGKAKKLKELALDHKGHGIAPRAQFEALRFYMKAGMEDADYTRQIERWNRVKDQRKQEQDRFRKAQETAEVQLQDTSLTEQQQSQYRVLTDSTLIQPDISRLFPYRGNVWDMARSTADTFMVYFKSSDLLPTVVRLREELRMPESNSETIQPVDEPDPVANTPQQDYLSCENIGKALEIRGGMQPLLDQIELNEKFSKGDSLRYTFKVNRRGIPESYELLTKGVPSSISSAYERIFEESLTFEPMLYQGQAIAVQCSLNFPLGD